MSKATQQTKPNILFIMSDEHDAAVMGCSGDPLVRTPNLDRLANEGIHFNACYTPSPLCVPARLSVTAGKYVSRCGAYHNHSMLPSADYPSLPRLLRSVGYTPYLCGKQHYDARRRYGYIDLIPNFNAMHKKGRGHRRDPRNKINNTEVWKFRSDDFHVGESSSIINHDRLVTDTALTFFEEYDKNQEPFFMHVGYLAPHFPLVAPDEIYQYYKGKVPAPIPGPEKLPFNYRQHQLGFGTDECTEEQLRNGRDLYWALTDWFDREVGRLLDGLRSSDVADNTIIIYTSDHGENKGDHGLWWKNAAYDHSARVPLLVSWPARWAGGQRRTEACGLLDVVQMIAEISGVETPEDWDGDSLLALCDDAGADWKDTAVSEYYGHNVSSAWTMYREGPWKYVYHCSYDEEHPAQRQLFNMHDDPEELNDLADDPRYLERMENMHAAMVKEIGGDPEEKDAEFRANMDNEYDRSGEMRETPALRSALISSGGGARVQEPKV